MKMHSVLYPFRSYQGQRGREGLMTDYEALILTFGDGCEIQRDNRHVSVYSANV